jgi:hypothetical protein
MTGIQVLLIAPNIDTDARNALRETADAVSSRQLAGPLPSIYQARTGMYRSRPSPVAHSGYSTLASHYYQSINIFSLRTLFINF